MILDTFKRLTWTDYFLYALTDPRELYRRIRQKDPDPFPLSFAVPAAAALFDILAMSVMGSESGFFYYKVSYGWIFMFIYGLLKTVIYSALVDAAAQLYGYRGNIREVITLANFALFPGMLFMPFVLLFAVINFAPGFFYVFFSIAFFVWSVMVFVQSLSEMHAVEFGRAFIIAVVPVLFVIITLFLMALLVVITGVGFLTA